MTNLSNISPRVLRRLERMAQEEEAKFQKALEKEKAHLETLQGFKHHSTFGSHQNMETLIKIDGVPCVVTTDSYSRISSINELTQEVYDNMELSDKQAVTQFDKVLGTRLSHRDYDSKGKSDKYYKVFSEAQGQPLELVQELGRDIEKEYGSEAWSQFSSPEHREQGISKQAELIMSAYSKENRIKLANEISNLEDKISTMEKTGEIIGDSSIGGDSE
ncbi:hypothetical protein [Bacillus thuringiensis]|uniref:hypothetical protein n=1 Tax=Bacillus thuringiensis TaxID=1428 RepID=UPI001298D547|nr:hypothetical protein [Bacillus thuringiensis]MEB8931070.1 hypothetical protein [Bacillus cereus]MCR6787884.1 hypothetical protein [Bacillus thuringiensis]MCR6822430.1 hypothetical protein [Bacillus thuringiensis]MCR6829960.1 hypothetical protein [Bacillus thuringiensis]MEB9324986.1 hypothetical protein [Bacillus cereus]